jgi:starch-binding outer membrane protein, SusD/RagB family
MHKMKNLKIYLLGIIGLVAMQCSDRIDDTPKDFYSIDLVFSDSTYVRQFVNNIYTFLPRGYNRIDGATLACVTDDAVHCSVSLNAINMAKGIWGPSLNPDNQWNFNYTGIRRANDFLLNVLPNIPDKLFKSQQTIDMLAGQVYFLRALFHFELLKRYGGIPIVTEIFDANSGIDIPRNTYDECIDFIVSECDKAASLLPTEYSDKENDFGRITKGASYALKSRALLYAASQFFNDPAENKESYEHRVYNDLGWEEAAKAAHDVIALDVYSLYPDYGLFFNTLQGNEEIILSRMEAASNFIEMANGPSGYTGGRGGTGPSLNLVEAYDMADGSKFDWNYPQMAENPFANRDPRFYASILFNGVQWMGETVDTYEGGDDMDDINSTRTGFYMKKFLSEEARWFGGTTGTAYHCFPLIRYAEILLNYAEAMNEAYGPEIDPKGYGMTAKQAVEMIRERAGLIPFRITNGLSKNEMRDVIRHERRIELAFEEHRSFDVRRWKIAEQTLGGTIYGLKIIKENDGSYTYSKVKVEDRVFSSKMYLYPIPQYELNWNAALVQNSGW